MADAAWATPLQLVAQRPAGPVPQFTECSDDEAEAATVAVKVRELLDAGTPASQVAVLFRTNGQSEAYEQALASAGIGYQLRGGERFFARKEVRDAILQLRAATRAVAETASARAARASWSATSSPPWATRTRPRTAAARSGNAGNRWPPSWRWPTNS